MQVMWFSGYAEKTPQGPMGPVSCVLDGLNWIIIVIDCHDNLWKINLFLSDWLFLRHLSGLYNYQ